jgi:hypothetical protein
VQSRIEAARLPLPPITVRHERVFVRGWGKRDWIERDPDYDILRDDPRFQKLLTRLK